jgi:hypothetical protein
LHTTVVPNKKGDEEDWASAMGPTEEEKRAIEKAERRKRLVESWDAKRNLEYSGFKLSGQNRFV